MKRIHRLLVLVPALVAGWACEGSDGTVADAGGDPGRAAAPRIVFERTDVDAGTVPYDQWVEAVYPFRNEGDAPLVLEVPLPAIEALEGC